MLGLGLIHVSKTGHGVCVWAVRISDFPLVLNVAYAPVINCIKHVEILMMFMRSVVPEPGIDIKEADLS